MVARWLDDGVAPNGARGRAFGERGVHGFDLTFCAPKSVSLVRALRADEVVAKAIADAHTTALAEAMEYLAAHAGYTRVHNPVTGREGSGAAARSGGDRLSARDVALRGSAPAHPRHRAQPPSPRRRPLVSLDGTSLYHEAKAAGVIYQATLRRELHRSLGFEWAPVDPATGMAEIAGVDRDTITAWSRRSSQLREWAAHNLTSRRRRQLSAAQLAAAQKATRPAKPEELAWARAPGAVARRCARAAPGPRCLRRGARGARARPRAPRSIGRASPTAAARIDKAAFTRADLVEIVGAQLPVDTERSHRASWSKPRSTRSACG